MAVRRKRKMHNPRAVVPIEHTGFYASVQRYLEALTILHHSASNLRRRESAIRRFVAWCDERSIDRPQDVTRPILERYQTHLYHYRQENGEPLSIASQARYLVMIRQYFKWLSQQRELLSNPASELVLPKVTPSLPVVLSVEELGQLLDQPDVTSVYGLRDRAILEVFYSTGIRRSELCRLQVTNLSLPRQTLCVREGKGGKDRVLPVGRSAQLWLQRYLTEVRPQLLLDVQEQTLFLNDYGEAFADSKLGDKVKRYLKQAGINAPGSCHLLRHAMATHMLENGADIRYIQAMLGHSNLETTQVYTHVSIRKLQEIHAATHPAVLDRSE